jgi:glutathione synthase/RimK-type ligase-like ATP-grasp enzyme
MSLGILFERAETDEMGIKLTAEELGIDLKYIPFRKVSICLNRSGYRIRGIGKDYSDDIRDVAVVLNRTQSKNRRFIATYILETLGKHVINPSKIEFLCFSKLRTLLNFWRAGIKIPKTVYIPCDSYEVTKDGREIRNEEEIADLIQLGLGNEEIVIKPDAGTHGKMVRLAKNRKELLMNIQEVKPSIINPVGILAQEFVQKWFYDLRIIVAKEKGKAPYCHPKGLARAGFKDFRTNTFLGNLVFGVKLPFYIRNMAVKCGEALGKNNDAWLLALDAMIDVGENKSVDDELVKLELEKLVIPFDAVKRVKADENKKRDFPNWSKKLEEAFQNYMNSEAYEKVRRIIEENVEENKHNIIFHEANACPEFWEQTRLVAGINLAVPLLKGAQSVVES